MIQVAPDLSRAPVLSVGLDRHGDLDAPRRGVL
jgi:hypothetical protein